jgi:PAS domain S-box-containing protein
MANPASNSMIETSNDLAGADRAAKPPGTATRLIHVIAACSALLMCVIVAGTAAVIINLRAQALADTERELRNMALVLTEQIDRSFEAVTLVESSLVERMNRLGVVSADKLRSEMASHDAHLMLKDMINGLPHIENLTVTDARGTIINFNRAWPVPALGIADRTYFKVLTTNRNLTTILSEPILNRLTGTWSIYLARKIFGAQGEMIGIVVSGMEQRYFERYFSTINLGPGSSISLFRRDGMLLASYPLKREPEPSEAEWLRSINDQTDRGTVGTIDAGSEKRMAAARAVTHYPMIVSVSIPMSSVLAGWRSQALYLGIAAAFAVLMIASIAILAIHHFRNYSEMARERRERVDAAVQHKATEFVLRETERVHKLLTKQKVQLDAALDNMLQGLVMVDGDAKMLLCNRRYIEMYGLSPEIVKPGCTMKKLIEHQLEVGVITGNADEIIERILALIARGKPSSDLRTLADGRIISVSAQPMEGGGWLSTHQDITEQQRAERETQRAQKFLLTVLESVPLTIVVKDARSLRYLLINRAGEKFYGISRGEVMGRTSHDLFPKETAAMMVAYDKKLLESSGQLNLGPHTIETTNGPRVVTAKQVAIRDENAKPMFLVSILEEVGEHKRTEAA